MSQTKTKPVMLRRALVGIGEKDEILDLPVAEADRLIDGEQADELVEREDTEESLALKADARELAGGIAPGDSDAPTSDSTRAQIDTYGKAQGVDTTGAASKKDALALLGIT